mmetsp:Transcript_43136/g.140538  ORF Transcript_43136/g.140538 Transcript_43136/m.140538 type:complete len:445 (+) Transcript_43136:1010-2344(+)
MCVLAYGTSSPSMASMPGCSAVRGCGSSSISVALTYSRKGASACLPDVRSTNVLSASQRPTRRMTSKSTQPSSKSARGASCAEVVSQRVLHAHTEKNGASSVRHASLPFGLKRSPPAYCRCASISQRACVGREGGVSACRQRCGTSERPPEGPHVEASLAHPAEVLRAEVEVRGEGPLHREEAVEEAPLRRLRDAHHVEPLSAATAEEARRRNRPGRLSRRLEQRDAQRVCRAAGQHADREGGDGGVGVLPREEAVDQLVHHPVPAHAHHGVHLGRLDLRSDFPHVPRVRRHHLGQRDAVRLEEGAAAGVDAPRVARARHRVDQHQPPLLTRRRRVGSHAVHDIPHRCCPPLGLAAVAAGHPGLRGLAVRRAEAAAAVQRHAMQHQLAALGGGTDAVGERHRLHAACRRQRHVLDDLPRHVEPPAARLLAQESGVAEEELLRAH